MKYRHINIKLHKEFFKAYSSNIKTNIHLVFIYLNVYSFLCDFVHFLYFILFICF